MTEFLADLKAQLRAVPKGRDYVGQGYNFAAGSEKAQRARRWLDLISEDVNYSRMLFGLPLLPPAEAKRRAIKRKAAIRAARYRS